MKGLIGVLLKDLYRYMPALIRGGAGYLALSNRTESLELSPDGSGYRCDWHWTSDLHAPKVLPFLGRWLMKRALADYPIRRLPRPDPQSSGPNISFIIGHRGIERLPHLLATLESIAGQRGAAVECIVVEQEPESFLIGRLPDWVRRVHTPPPTSDMPYCRSWAFNVGVSHARAPVLVLHDNDMLVPEDYTAEIVRRVEQGYEVANLKRFVFYLNSAHTKDVLSGRSRITDQAPETIIQNLEAGGSVAITRKAYDRIGGMDESFIGWGGEDNEFWERAQTCKVWSYGYLPIVHLWHPAQLGKHRNDNPIWEHYHNRSSIPADARISHLHSLSQGAVGRPFGYR